MWLITFHWFFATNKTNYVIMSIYVTAFRHAMVASLVRIWTVMRTASLAGHAACNVAHDLVMERENRSVKQFVKNHARNLRDRLQQAPSLTHPLTQ